MVMMQTKTDSNLLTYHRRNLVCPRRLNATANSISSHTHRLLDVEFECKTIQLEAATICDVALSRKKMLDAGIGRDEVDRLLPQ
ncbi:hypothetical protein PI125_g17522 [Phytophthora idaei]|nr:hypothetical protein PI125_g17522 [Phytophthora idaei]